MNILAAIAALSILVVLALLGFTRAGVWFLESRNPPVGTFADIDGSRIHFVHIPALPGADLPPVVFIHGASANLKDQMVPLRPLLEGRAELLFWDRPGYGWSSRGTSATQTPFDQARVLSRLMDQFGIKSAIIVGHSFGGAVETAFALAYPERVRGLVFLSPATHPWPGGATSWYYDWASAPVLGRLFVETLTLPAGLWQITGATECVFAPNPVAENYLKKASIELVLRPAAFQANARDVSGLYDYAIAASPRYGEIKSPTVIVTGDRDTVVAETIHSGGLARDIPGAELVWVHNMGHKPEWVAPELVVGAIEKVAGRAVDLSAIVQTVESRISSDAYGTNCKDEWVPPDRTGEHSRPVREPG